MKLPTLLMLLGLFGPLVEAEDLLSLAARGFHHDELRAELRASPGIANTLRDSAGRTALHLAAQGGQFEDILLLLEAGADANAVDEAGHTPLFYALQNRHDGYALLAVKVLAFGSADVNRREEDGSAPLAVAVARGLPSAAEFLIRRGAEIEPAGVPAGQQPVAIARGLGDEKMIAVLEAARALSALPPVKAPATKEAFEQRFLKAARAGDVALVSTLLAQGADTEYADADGATALFTAVKEHRPEMVSLLLAHGADANAPKNDGVTPLMAAVPFFDLEATGTFLMLLQAGANVQATTKDGRTPLSEAVAARNNFAAKWCIWRGAKLDVKTPKGTLMQIAKARAEWPSMIELLKQYGVHDDDALPVPPEQVIFEAVRKGDIAAVERELDAGRRADVTDDHGAPPLSWAAHYDRFDIVDLLIRHGAEVDQRNAKTGKTTFQEFALYGRGTGDAEVAADRMAALIERGADPNVVTKDGSTALMMAARTGTAGKNLSLLLKVTKDLNARNKDGKTALRLAREYGHQEVVEQLALNGATE